MEEYEKKYEELKRNRGILGNEDIDKDFFFDFVDYLINERDELEKKIDELVEEQGVREEYTHKLEEQLAKKRCVVRVKEEEIIKEVKTMFKDSDSKYWIGENGVKALQGLLDLYEKEKEKNKDLEKTILEFVNDRERILKTPVISKDTVREIIKELDERVTKEEKTNRFVRLTIGEALSFKHFLKQEVLKEE